MDCPSLLDILGFLTLPEDNVDLNTVEISTKSNLSTAEQIDQNLEQKQEQYKPLTESSGTNIMSGGSAQGDSTQMKVITLGSKRFVYRNNYAPKRKSAQRKQR